MRRDLIPILSLIGVILDALGGLYLAYDLLGGKKGPLRTVTKSISYGVLFAGVYWLPLGVWFGLAGLLVSGPTLSVEIERRNDRGTRSFLETLGYSLPRALSFGVAGWLSKDAGFGIAFGILCAIGLVAAYMIVGPPTLPGRPRINRAVLKRGVVRALTIGLAAVLSGAIHKERHALSYGIEVGLVTGLASGVLLSIAPAIEAWVDNLPTYRLGAYGAILVVIGSVLQTLQYLFPLLEVSASRRESVNSKPEKHLRKARMGSRARQITPGVGGFGGLAQCGGRRDARLRSSCRVWL